MKFRLIAARHGVGSNAKPWGSLTFVSTINVAGAQVDVIASRFVSDARIAMQCDTALSNAKAKGAGLFVEVTDCVLRTDRSQYTPKGADKPKWGTQHSIVGGKFGALTEEINAGGNVEMVAFASSLPEAVTVQGEADLPPEPAPAAAPEPLKALEPAAK